MRIDRFHKSALSPRDVIASIAQIPVPGNYEDPACGPPCDIPAPRDCHRHCPNARFALSCEPEKYPVEKRIVPLVFEMRQLRVFQPCWSCEGHDAADGRLTRIPRIWFYANAQVHLRLLNEGLAALNRGGTLNAEWHVTLAHSAMENPDTLYSLEPRRRDGPGLELAKLQLDIDVMAENLSLLVYDEGRKLAKTIR